MKFQIISDIHLDGGRTRQYVPVATQLENLLVPAEGLIFAGDMSNTDDEKIEAFELFAQHYKKVLVVLGNHDCWHKEFPPTRLIERIKNVAPGRLHLLENESVEIDGTTFHGCTLWFNRTRHSQSIDKSFADFYYIPNGSALYQAHKDSVEYITNNVKEGDVVITHHTPSLQSVPERYKGDAYTCFFSNPYDWLVQQTKPKLWIHGHTHNHFDYMIDNTRILCNPRGYEGEHEANYQPLVLDL